MATETNTIGSESVSPFTPAFKAALLELARSENPEIINRLTALAAPASPKEDMLLDVDTIGPAVFENPPSKRWIRTQTRAGILPCVRVGKLIFYDLKQVRAALGNHCAVKAKIVCSKNAN